MSTSPKPIIDLYSPQWGQATLDRLKTLHAAYPDHRPVALLDGAFLFERLLPWMEQWLPDGSWQSLYTKLPNTNRRIIQASPQLVDLNMLDNAQSLALLGGTNGYPMLSIMMTSAPLTQLVSQLMPFCIVGTPIAHYALRFADTRLLPAIFDLLNEEQQSLLTKDIAVWQYVNRATRWESLPLQDQHDQNVIPPINGIVLDNDQYTALMASAQIDRAMAFIEDTSPELYDCWQKPSERYAWFQQHMVLADAPTSLAELPAYLEQHAEHQQLLAGKKHNDKDDNVDYA